MFGMWLGIAASWDEWAAAMQNKYNMSTKNPLVVAMDVKNMQVKQADCCEDLDFILFYCPYIIQNYYNYPSVQ